nr:uncharacterized protein LOC127314985 [Lolium perenne]
MGCVTVIAPRRRPGSSPPGPGGIGPRPANDEAPDPGGAAPREGNPSPRVCAPAAVAGSGEPPVPGRQEMIISPILHEMGAAASLPAPPRRSAEVAAPSSRKGRGGKASSEPRSGAVATRFPVRAASHHPR